MAGRIVIQGQFLWSGMDYLGEPTPYDVFPVKSSFFGAVDTAGFPKDTYYLFRSQWTKDPMVHLVPMNWTDHEPGEPVQVWAYSNVDTVELFLNGRSLGVGRFDRKTTIDGRPYLETTEPTGDDKTVTSGPFPGSYTSPNGSAGKLHLTWSVPFAPGRLVAVARRDGREVARDEVDTAGAPAAVRLTPDKRSITADGRSLSYLTVDVVDADGVIVPEADNAISFRVTGAGRLVGLDNGREEDAENYKASTRQAFNGKALAIVESGDQPGPITVTATAPGLAAARATILASRAPGAHGAARHRAPAGRSATGSSAARDAPASPTADASYSGAPDTLPAAMLDGDPATAWSNFYRKDATALLPAFSLAHPREWVSVSWAAAHAVHGLRAAFTVDATHALPAGIGVSYWDGSRLVEVSDLRVEPATASGAPTTITFAPVSTTKLRLELTSAHPKAADGFFAISELQVTADEVH
jgi:beta-galactosidase